MTGGMLITRAGSAWKRAGSVLKIFDALSSPICCLCRLTWWNKPEQVFIREHKVKDPYGCLFGRALKTRSWFKHYFFKKSLQCTQPMCSREVLTCQEFSHETVFSPYIFCHRRDVLVTLNKIIFYEADCVQEAKEGSQKHSRGNK